MSIYLGVGTISEVENGWGFWEYLLQKLGRQRALQVFHQLCMRKRDGEGLVHYYIQRHHTHFHVCIIHEFWKWKRRAQKEFNPLLWNPHCVSINISRNEMSRCVSIVPKWNEVPHPSIRLHQSKLLFFTAKIHRFMEHVSYKETNKPDWRVWRVTGRGRERDPPTPAAASRRSRRPWWRWAWRDSGGSDRAGWHICFQRPGGPPREWRPWPTGRSGRCGSGSGERENPQLYMWQWVTPLDYWIYCTYMRV